MSHLTQAELTRWLGEGRAEDREAVLSHLAACDACRAALADLVNMQVPAADSARFEARDFVASGRDAYRPTPRYATRRTWTIAMASLGVAAAVVLAVAIPALRTNREQAPIPAETRGGDLNLLEPRGDIRGAFEFHWSSPVAASTYRVTVFDAGNRVIYTAVSRGERLPVPADVRARLVAGEKYSWSVDALDAGESRIIGSSQQPFTIAAER